MSKYLAIFSLSFSQTLKNYKALVGLSIFLITCLIIFAYLWKVVATKAGATSLNPHHLLWYIAFNEWLIVSLPDVQEEMEQDLRSGRLAYLLPRPISYLGATFAEAMGTLSANMVVLGAVTFGFTWWQAGALPFQGPGLLLVLLFGITAGCIAILFLMLIGLSAFWLSDVTPCYWLWEKSLFALGGLMLPLTVYPEWLQKIAFFTPFPAILGDRSALALDFSLNHIFTLAATLLFWGGCAYLILKVLYRKGLRILNIEGG